jgi:hypothetical protein
MIQCLELTTSFWKSSLSREMENNGKKEVLWYFQILINDKYIAGRQNHRVKINQSKKKYIFFFLILSIH